MNSTDAKQSAGYFREKAIIGLGKLTGDEIDTAIMKTTSHMLKAPKEKYMQSLLAASYGHCKRFEKGGLPIHEYIVKELEKRSHTHNWVVVLKTYVVLHRLLCDGSDDMVTCICTYKHIFQTHSRKDLATNVEGASQEYFIDQYCAYLEERCMSQTRLGRGKRMETAEFAEYASSLNAAQLPEMFVPLLMQLEALVRVAYRELIVNNFCTLEAYQLVIRDGKTLYQILSQRVVYVLNGFEHFPLPLKKDWLELYKRFAAAVLALKRTFDAMLDSTRAFMEPVPRLKALPDSLQEELERDVAYADDQKPEVCSLASLGINSEDRTPAHKNEELAASTKPVAQNVPAKADPAPATAPASAPTAPSHPVVAGFNMDDLFSFQETPASPPTATQTVLPPNSVNNTYAAAMPQQSGWEPSPAFQPRAPAAQTTFDGWSSGAPTGWSSGAPVPPAQSATNASNTVTPTPAVFTAQPTVTPGAPVTQVHPAKKKDDVFKDLYSDTQNQWKS